LALESDAACLSGAGFWTGGVIDFDCFALNGDNEGIERPIRMTDRGLGSRIAYAFNPRLWLAIRHLSLFIGSGRCHSFPTLWRHPSGARCFKGLLPSLTSRAFLEWGACRHALLTALITAVTLSYPLTQPAAAWNGLGHRIVAKVAERHLSENTREQVLRLLGLEGKHSMRDVASWADRVKGLLMPVQPSHLVHLALDNSGYDSKTQCRGNRCIIGAIKADIALLSSNDANDEARLLALKYLIHFVGDIHQPLHTIADCGDVIFQGNRHSLHSVWDKEIIASAGKSEGALVRDVDDDEVSVDAAKLDPVAWALESRDMARDILLPAIGGCNADRREGDGNPPVLASSYGNDNWPIARARLKLAGLRLANVLNAIFDKGGD